jgi:hypothetical protein
MNLSTLSTLFQRQHTAYHNLCTTLQPPHGVERLLWLGLKFNLEKAIPKPSLDAYIDRLRRDIRIKFHIDADSQRVVIDNTGRKHTLKSKEFDPKLYIRSQDYDPEPATPDIEGAIDTFQTKLQQLIHTNPTRRQHNILPSTRRILRTLQDDHSYIILPTDKNLGPAILERSTYIKRCLQDHLLDTSSYRRLTPVEAYLLLQTATVAMEKLIQCYRHTIAEHEQTYFHRVFQLTRRIPPILLTPQGT